MRAARCAHFRRVSVVNAVVVRLAVLGEDRFHLGIERISVHIERFLGHTDAAEGLQRALERLIGLQSDDLFKLLVEIARLVRSQRRNDFRIRVQYPARLAFFLGQIKNDVPKLLSSLRCGREKGSVPLVRRIIALNKIPDVYFVVIPFSGNESFPSFVLHSISPKIK